MVDARQLPSHLDPLFWTTVMALRRAGKGSDEDANLTAICNVSEQTCSPLAHQHLRATICALAGGVSYLVGALLPGLEAEARVCPGSAQTAVVAGLRELELRVPEL